VAGIAPVVGRDEAERLVEDALAADDGLGSALAAEPRLAGIDLDGLLDPRGYLGSAGELVDRALAAHTAARRTTTR
jgi:3-carboxy-cis,cis-muconate cycloisomerase